MGKIEEGIAILKTLGLPVAQQNERSALTLLALLDLEKRFCPYTKVVYVGDAARKMLFTDANLINELKIPITEHDKLPDVILYDRQKNQLFLIEAVTVHGPLSPKRQQELEDTLKDCTAMRIYVSVFPDFREFKRHIDNIAWETEVWIENNPDHMIHFNGLKFVTAYSD